MGRFDRPSKEELESHLLPRFRDVFLRHEQAKALGEVIRDTDADELGHMNGVASAGDLRGIPALARGIGGAIRGSLPHVEVPRRLSDRRDPFG